MKIVDLTPIQLTLERRPIVAWMMGGVFFVIGMVNLLFGGAHLLSTGIDFGSSAIILNGIVSLFAAFLVISYHGKIVTCHFDKTTRQFTLTRSLAGSSEITQYPLQEIVGVCLRGNYQSDEKLYYLCLIMNNVIFVPLNAYARPLKSGGSNFVEGQAAANCISTFLNFDSVPVIQPLSYQSSLLTWRLAFARKKKVEAEINRLHQIICQDPGDVNTRYVLISLLQVRQRIEEARTLLEQSRVTLLERREFLKSAQLNEEFRKDPRFRQP